MFILLVVLLLWIIIKERNIIFRILDIFLGLCISIVGYVCLFDIKFEE